MAITITDTTITATPTARSERKSFWRNQVLSGTHLALYHMPCCTKITIDTLLLLRMSLLLLYFVLAFKRGIQASLSHGIEIGERGKAMRSHHLTSDLARWGGGMGRLG